MKITVSELAKLFDISVRTLHYYDEIGLLSPFEKTEAGYRIYSDDEISTLQQILFYRELEIPLVKIKEIISSPNYNKEEILRKHRQLLVLKRNHIDSLLLLVDETMGGKSMSNLKTTAKDIDNFKAKHANEVKEKWGDSCEYKQSNEKYNAMSDKDKEEMFAAQEKILIEFSNSLDKSADSVEVQSLVKKWQDNITEYHYNCTNEILSCLGEMYVADERFTENLDRYGKGTAKHISDAIKVYCNENK